jgi:hypothetical protein
MVIRNSWLRSESNSDDSEEDREEEEEEEEGLHPSSVTGRVSSTLSERGRDREASRRESCISASGD